MYIYSGKLNPVIYKLNGINRVTITPISQQVYLKLPFIRINTYITFTRQRVYLVIICSKITYNLPLIAESEAIFRTSKVILVFTTRKMLLQP